MNVFDSYVSLFHTSPENRSARQETAFTPVNSTISQSAYKFVSFFDRALRKN